MIPAIAIFAFSSCSPKVSNNTTASPGNSSTYGGDGSALKASQEAQNKNVSMEVKEEVKDVKPSNATPPTY